MPLDIPISKLARKFRTLEDMRIFHVFHIERNPICAFAVYMLRHPNRFFRQVLLEILISGRRVQSLKHVVIEIMLLFIGTHAMAIKTDITEAIFLRKRNVLQIKSRILNAIDIIGFVILGDKAHISPFLFQVSSEIGCTFRKRINTVKQL